MRSALRGLSSGLLAFNALTKDAPQNDAGLGGVNRFVYVSRLEGGVFGPPTRIHQDCGDYVVGRWQTVHIPQQANPNPFTFRPPD